MNAAAPSEKSMSKMADKVGDEIAKMTLTDLENLRRRLREEVQRRDPTGNACIPAEADGQYNTPLRSAPERTPRQPATQATLTVCENYTTQKKIMGVVTENKLCKRGQYYKSKGGNECPNHPGKCSQSLKPEMPIGDEERRSRNLMTDIMQSSQPLIIDRLTTDSDSHCYKGIQSVMKKVNIDVDHQKDPGHLSRSQRRSIVKMKFTTKVFPGRTKTDRIHYQKRFAIDLAKRCTAEHKVVSRMYKGDEVKLRSALDKTPLAIIDCYSGKCGETCQKYSYVCKGTASNHWERQYIPGGGFIRLDSQSDRNKVLALINLRLRPKILSETKYDCSTQKTEAVHKAYRKSDPKGITYTRNFTNRTLSAVSRVNDGIGSSTLRKLETIGAPRTPGNRAAKTLKSIDTRNKYHAKRQNSAHYKLRRSENKLKNFRSYDNLKDISTVYKKGLTDVNVVIDHEYTKS